MVSGFLSKPFRFFISMSKEHKGEWYIIVAGALILFVIIFSSVFAGIIAPYGPVTDVASPYIKEHNLDLRAATPLPPNETFIMGTNDLGFDVFSRILFGSRTVLLVSIAASIFSALMGIPIGLLSGFYGGKVDRTLSLLMDSIYSFPGLILAIALAAMLGPGVTNISVAIAVIYVPTYFRIVRGQVLSVKEELYVEAARSIGAGPMTIMTKYVFPNVIASVVVIFSLNVADAILTEAGLSFLGLGLPPDLPDWGIDLAKGKKFVPSGYWWIITFPGLMIMLVALSFTMIGEGLNEVLNPRLKEK
ncbi:MAG: ABC transporter permease [Deltaproteobacteria bacterium]|nr:ABC transporter permease [Candidatus Zymogenaceae bacterium]